MIHLLSVILILVIVFPLSRYAILHTALDPAGAWTAHRKEVIKRALITCAWVTLIYFIIVAIAICTNH